jgi:carbamoyltransferase
MTARIGLKPNEDEYILMGMSAYGDPWRFFDSIKAEICDAKSLHRGCMWWNPDLKEEDYFDVAAATQMIYELIFRKMLEETQKLTRNSNLVFSGGCALNCLANRHIRQYFDNHWIMPNPGDAGSSIGAVAARNKTRIEWDTPYLGYDIKGAYPIDDMLRELKDNKIVGVANGKAEFGPRSLGNRSLLADPRGQEMKVLVNKIKKRQEFRPFAPVILQEDVHKYFKVNRRFKSPYMQEIVECRNPELFPAIVHKDGTSRIQTVNSEQHSGLAQLLRRWKAEGNHPILLNTSLNIKGQPMVNTEVDGKEFTEKYGVKVCVG